MTSEKRRFSLNIVWTIFLERIGNFFPYLLFSFIALRLLGFFSPTINQAVAWNYIYSFVGLVALLFLVAFVSLARFDVLLRFRRVFLSMRSVFIYLKNYLVSFFGYLYKKNGAFLFWSKMLLVLLIFLTSVVFKVSLFESSVILYIAFSILFVFSYKKYAKVSLALLVAYPILFVVGQPFLAGQSVVYAYYFLFTAFLLKIFDLNRS